MGRENVVRCIHLVTQCVFVPVCALRAAAHPMGQAEQQMVLFAARSANLQWLIHQ